MKRTMILCAIFALTFAMGCSGDDAEKAEKAVSQAADTVEKGASDMMDEAGDAANAMAADAVAACRDFAEKGDWGRALEVCRKAHEMMPDDLALEHAYQQAQAAAVD